MAFLQQMRLIVLAGLVLSLLLGQSQSSEHFEVASVKAAHPTGSPARRTSGGPGTASPGQITYHEESLKDLLFIAYRVQFYQLAPPAWMEGEYFDIVAKLPSGASQDDVRRMLQNLLAERFRLTLHHETREASGYALAVGRAGPQLRESAPAPAEPEGEVVHLSSRRTAVDREGFLILPPSQKPNIVALPAKGGVSRVTAARATMALFCGFLSRQLQRPVVDETRLAGAYDFHLAFATSRRDFLRRRMVLIRGTAYPARQTRLRRSRKQSKPNWGCGWSRERFRSTFL